MDQNAHYQISHRKYMDRIHTFLEIMNGPNPLTPDEIRAMAKKRPEKYEMFLNYAERMERENASR